MLSQKHLQVLLWGLCPNSSGTRGDSMTPLSSPCPAIIDKEGNQQSFISTQYRNTKQVVHGLRVTT